MRGREVIDTKLFDRMMLSVWWVRIRATPDLTVTTDEGLIPSDHIRDLNTFENVMRDYPTAHTIIWKHF